MAASCKVSDGAPKLENWSDDSEIVNLPGGLPRVIRDQHIASAQCLWRKHFHKMLHARRHCVDMARSASHRLGHHARPLIEYTAGQIL